MKVAVIGTGHIADQFRKHPSASSRPFYFASKFDFEQKHEHEEFDRIFIVDSSERENYTTMLSVISITKTSPITITLTSRELQNAVQKRRNKEQKIRVVNPYESASYIFTAAIPKESISINMRPRVHRPMLPSLSRALQLFGIVITAYFAIMIVFGVLSSFVMHTTLWQGLYFSSTTLTSVGYGDVLPDKTKISEMLLAMIMQNVGNLSIACVCALFFEIVTVMRQSRASGHLVYKNKNHIVVCGGGRLSYEICRRLLSQNEQVIVIEKHVDNEYVSRIKDELGIPVYIDTAYSKKVLSRVNIFMAKALITTTQDDTTNYLVSSLANEMVPDLTIIARIYDDEEREVFEDFINANHFEAHSVSSLSYPEISKLM